jgi:hypothetical protein
MQRSGAPASAARQWQALSEQPGGELRACPQVAAVSATLAWVFRTIVTDRFGIVTVEFGSVTDHFGDVTDGR